MRLVPFRELAALVEGEAGWRRGLLSLTVLGMGWVSSSPSLVSSWGVGILVSYRMCTVGSGWGSESRVAPRGERRPAGLIHSSSHTLLHGA